MSRWFGNLAKVSSRAMLALGYGLVVAGCLILAPAFAPALAPALANDSSAELAAGGIRLVPNWDVVIDREDLFLSPDVIGVRYVFRNTTDQPVRVLVAFPLPDIDMAELFDVPIDIPFPDNENFVDFELAVNGVRADFQVERRAVSLGIDRTEMLERHFVPLNPFSDDAHSALNALSPEIRDEFVRLGIAHANEPHDPLMPFWTLKTVFYWEQEFPPLAETTVEHRYRPVVGAGFFGKFILDEQDLAGSDQPDTGNYIDKYCIDTATQNGIRKRISDSGGEYLLEHRLSYILSTARNWQGRIGTFRLVIDKMDPSWLVSVCLKGLKKIAPTQFEFVSKDYIPERDLNILFLEPPQ